MQSVRIPVEKFLLGAEEIGFDELDHAVVFNEIVLERGAGEGDSPFRLHRRYHLGNRRCFVLKQMAFVAHDQIST